MLSTPGPLGRALALALGAATVLVATASPASSAAAPVGDLAATLGPRGLLLTWTNPASGTPIVRDVTGEPGPTYDPAGPALTASAVAGCPVSTCLHDATFTNTSSRTYAVWATDDGTAAGASPTPALLTVDPLPPVPTAASLAVTTTRLTYNRSVGITGSLTRAGLPFPGARVRVVSTVLGGATSTLTTLTTGVDGTVRWNYVPTRSRTYRLVFLGDAFSAPSASSQRTVWVAPRVLVRFADNVLEWKQTAALKGAVAPGFPGKVVAVQRWTGSSWTTVARRTLSSTSTFVYGTRMPIGRWTFRAVLPQETDHSSGISAGAVLTVTPRTLVQGLSGPDVLALERKLATLRYDVGTVDGSFDYDLRHAVTAFQKVERLARTGKWTATERTRVMSPRGFTPRYRDGRLTAEVDVTRQVMALVRDGRVLRIVDVSTGSEDYYWQDGVRHVAHTPRGVFSVYRKIDGVRVSALGELYRPSYFHQGWAIHGSGSVPTYPASHGCVRITNPVADRLFGTLAIGTRVAVYN